MIEMKVLPMKKFILGIPLLFTISCIPPSKVFAEWIGFKDVRSNTVQWIQLESITRIDSMLSSGICSARLYPYPNASSGYRDFNLGSAADYEQCSQIVDEWLVNVLPARRIVTYGE